MRDSAWLRFRRAAVLTATASLVLLSPLAVPSPVVVPAAAPEGARPFVWARDSLWSALEERFVAARATACGDSAALVAGLRDVETAVDRLAAARPAPDDPAFDRLEASVFALAPGVAACGALVPRFVALHGRVRQVVKDRSVAWDLGTLAARDRLYRALYGGRAAMEEVLLQQPGAVDPLLRGRDEPSATPSAVHAGVTLHSGDILVSRGGYPTSALIARGNDYPGNFSHIALVHVDSATRAVTVIEAHIELGVALTTAEGYLADKKLRVMLLRPRADLPALRRDPMLPHRAASAMLERARREHIPYDFTMDYTDASRLFCSEVASQAYRAEGLTLWTGLSTISRPGLRHWLASFGVERFETQEPSDLEYDPQLTVVAEWHDPAALFDDHVDNAVTDAMLEQAEAGRRLTYPWYQLPLARGLKAWSWSLERFGAAGPIPEGMSPAAALRNRAYGERHRAIGDEVRVAVQAFRAREGYAPPFWALVDMAREAVRTR